MSLLPVEDALALIKDRIPAPTPETVPIGDASGRILLQPLVAQHNQPPFDASAMDGYAVRATEIIPGKSFDVVGMSQAGAGYSGPVGPGQVVRIFTGAPVPVGSDTVIMQEQAQAQDNHVVFTTSPTPGHSVRRMGSDFAAGQTLIDAGTLLTPFHLAVAAAANHAGLIVAKRPSLAILATGDELVLPGAALQPDQIVASNSFALAPLLRPYSERVTDYGIARDNRGELRSKLEAVLANEPDVLITTGGASVGDHDIVQEILVDLGVELDFWRINMRPGKPLMFGVRGKTLVFGLPGNPVSALVTAVVFIKPALRHWLGHQSKAVRRLRLAAATPANTARRHFMRARLVQTDDGPQALPILVTDSGHTSSLGSADLLIVQPESDLGQPEGSMVETIALDAF